MRESEVKAPSRPILLDVRGHLVYVSTQDDWLRQMLLLCTVSDVRAGFADMLRYAMRCLRPTELQHFAEAQAVALADVQVSMQDGADGEGEGAVDMEGELMEDELMEGRTKLGRRQPLHKKLPSPSTSDLILIM